MLSAEGHVGVPETDRFGLRQHLAPVDAPESGDVIFYKTDYAMLRFESHDAGEPSWVGMTTWAVFPLDLDYGTQIVGYGRAQIDNH